MLRAMSRVRLGDEWWYLVENFPSEMKSVAKMYTYVGIATNVDIDGLDSCSIYSLHTS